MLPISPLDDQGEQSPREECGVFGVWAPSEDVSKLTYFGLFALQHRGQEAAGIAVGDGDQVVVFKDLGLVSQVFDEQTLDSLRGDVAIGHTRYSTAGGVTWENSQPMFRVAQDGTDIALCHNGNLVNYLELMGEAGEAGLVDPETEPSDSDVMTALLSRGVGEGRGVLESARELLPRIRGAFCLTITDGHTLYAARDPWGIRPLVLGRLEAGWVVASETCALDIVGASFVREVEPGELIAIDGAGVHSERFATGERKTCVFEYVYLARPDSNIHGRNVNESRLEIGRRLARECPADADLVIPVPESGNPAAVGYAQESGIPFGQGLVKNAYVGRTFIQPSQTLRQLGIRLKLNPLREVIAGKRLIVVDDSIVRGNTQRALIRMLREAGAAEVHVRIASPPVKWPCFYGIDFASPGELIANAVTGDNEEEIVASVCSALGADSLGFVSIDEMIAASAQPREQLCAACFDGEYPIGMPLGNRNAELVSAMKRSSCGGVD
ncbi:amidophosphoribosyltransferase [Corynebacterium sp. 153RC1]|uniref:amidophosphoribosyltransferase n=1 Tax=Corynebacterium TaxID=1716 RepID=UPI00211D0FAD|nr:MULTISPECIES: amidophosphoribosyltransferase [unclassified Corynebacterium]MCQ9371124.1 amidophosphoribosyltransferase [Corynebacterium sp. 35RC1]MCQ9343670.1 amidophosphoribosyltransferase [Corynebacterium sp. 76QC2CO]MCQ9353131.1 amidophosphoribosyltransferase [Corynebacterium sp. 209RC1]MCQ9355335.1 amidophosphoribosyltransferase [Corynebacterium sp. 1222RC1]MCQ9357717.1 amidophosphoribosyltransferase [Corynebacterium sp. 122RC1]